MVPQDHGNTLNGVRGPADLEFTTNVCHGP